MSDRPVITFAASIFEGDDLFVLTLLDHFGGDFSAVADLSAVDMHQHFEGGGFTRFNVQKIDVDRVAFRDAILPSASLNDCVGHKVFSGEKKPRKVSRNAWLSKRKVDRVFPALGTMRFTYDQHDLALWPVLFVMGEQFRRRSAAKFLEFLR